MSEYICKTNIEIPEYLFANIQIPTGLGVYAGQIFKADSLINKEGNYSIYTPNEITDITKDDICIVLNGAFEQTQDGRRPKGNPNYGKYKYIKDEIATVLRLNEPNLSIEISIDAISPGTAIGVGKYLVPANNAQYLNCVESSATITAKNFLKIEAIKYFRLGGEFGEEYTQTLVCRTMQLPKETYGISFNVTPSWATVYLYNSKGQIYTPSINNIYNVPKGDYTYSVVAKGYETMTNEPIVVIDKDITEVVIMEVDPEYCVVTFDKTPVDAEVIVYLDGDEVIENPDLSYSLVEGEYVYDATATGYTPQLDVTLSIETADLGVKKDIEVTLIEI